MRVFEDLGYYCLDNLPPALIHEVHTLYARGITGTKGLAIVSDVRSGVLFDDFQNVLHSLQEDGVNCTIVYLDCNVDILVNRYREVRRSHPLESRYPIREAIAREQERLEPILARASCVIDTSRIDVKTLRELILREVIGVEESRVTALRMTSFGFKYGSPTDADFIFDVRFLPNPYYLPQLRHLTGEDDEVYAYVMSSEKAGVFFDRMVALLDVAVASSVQVGQFSVNVAIGCTGGRHRSVAFVRRLCEFYSAAGRSVTRSHRDLSREL